MLRFIFKLNVAIGAAKRATFGRKIAKTWYERYIRHYVFFSLRRPNSYFMLSGDLNNSKWFPSGPSLLADTGVIQWSKPSYALEPIEKQQTRINFKHNNQSDLLANHHPDQDDEGQSQAKLFVHFDDLVKANIARVEEIDINADDEQNIDILDALDKYAQSDEDEGTSDVDTKN